MSKLIKLPNELNDWKVKSLVNSEKDTAIYKVSKKDFDGTIKNGILRHITGAENEDINFLSDEASFLESLIESGESFIYSDVLVTNADSDKKCNFYLITEDLKPLSEIMKQKNFSESEIVDFGIQLSEILEMLEYKNIYHGNITPDNIYITGDGKYKLGGFSDFEGTISDLSFVAPEIYHKESPDFTTDIYSLGLIMYAMSNNNKIPFESDNYGKQSSIEDRLSGKAVTAPANGSEKLKSVIVIACHPNNANRWKNAGNIKNALTSIKSELNDAVSSPSAPIIAPEATDFSDNVFEEYEYEEFEETIPDKEPSDDFVADKQYNVTESPEEKIADEPITLENNITKIDAAPAEEIADCKVVQDENIIANDSSSTESEGSKAFEPITDENVFDEYAADRKAKSFKKIAEEKDYGNYFDDDNDLKSDIKSSSEKTPQNKFEDVQSKDKIIKFKNDGFEGNNDFDFDYDDDENENNGKGKAKIAVIIVCIIVALAALCVGGYFALNYFNNQQNTPKETTVPTTEVVTTVQPTTVAPTTKEVTTAPVSANVVPVVGYGYSYGKELLEAEGFTVEISEYRDSYYYEEGYIIEQSPEGDTSAKKGSVVKLVVSSGLIEEETEPVTDSPVADSSYLFPNSDSSYLSYDQVHSLSDSDLQLAINEIYARNGRIFADPYLSSYFNSKSWYNGIYTAEEFDQNVTFNIYEQKNLDLLIDERATR